MLFTQTSPALHGAARPTPCSKSLAHRWFSIGVATHWPPPLNALAEQYVSFGHSSGSASLHVSSGFFSLTHVPMLRSGRPWNSQSSPPWHKRLFV
jgi:hypothetical protein